MPGCRCFSSSRPRSCIRVPFFVFYVALALEALPRDWVSMLDEACWIKLNPRQVIFDKCRSEKFSTRRPFSVENK